MSTAADHVNDSSIRSANAAGREPLALHQIIREAMALQHISRNRLAQAAGVSEGTIRNLLKENDTPGATGPQGLVLKAVCAVLDIAPIRVFQAAGFLSPNRFTPKFSVRAEILAKRFDRLPSAQQAVLLSLLEWLEKASGLEALDTEAGTALEPAESPQTASHVG
ncbi:MAG: helix-turn-helix domain-containing protein [Aggregatilineales bacterium]